VHNFGLFSIGTKLREEVCFSVCLSLRLSVCLYIYLNTSINVTKALAALYLKSWLQSMLNWFSCEENLAATSKLTDIKKKANYI
jgi:hypothetical protein